MRGRGEAADAVEGTELGVVRLRGDRHGGRGLARPDNGEPPILGWGWQMRRQAHVGVRRGDGRIVERQQPGVRL